MLRARHTESVEMSAYTCVAVALTTWCLFSSVEDVVALKPSPCPTVLVYEKLDVGKDDRWYGRITVPVVEERTGVSLVVVLDRRADLLGNDVGETTSTDNTAFSINNPKYVLKPNAYVRIFVKYRSAKQIPSVVDILFNGESICVVRTDNGSPETDRCGTVTTAVPLVTHGSIVSIGDYPWHAALYRYVRNDQQYQCGGSLVDKRYVVTAAHCVTRIVRNRNTYEVADPNDFTVYLGKQSLRNFRDEGIQESSVATVTVHPNYNHTNLRNDIAVVKLSRPAFVTDYVRTVCMWEGSAALSHVVDRLGSVVGWGVDEATVGTNAPTVSNQLRFVRLPIVEQNVCLYSNVEFFSRFTSENTFCAGYRNGTSLCNGDSGGGLFLPKKRSGPAAVWQLRGVVSLAAPDAGGKTCDVHQYVVFTDVAKYTTWIKAVLRK